MAVSRSRLEDGNKRFPYAALDKAGTAARDEHIDDTAQTHEGPRGGTVGGLDNTHGLTRKAACLNGIGKRMRDSDAGTLCHGAAAQDAGVTGANADTGGIGRHVGTGLVDHGDKTQRHAYLLQVKAAIDRAPLKHATHRVGKLGEFLETGCHPLDALVRKLEAIEQAGARARLGSGVHVESVLLENRRLGIAQGGRHRAHGSGTLLVGSKTQGPRRRLRRGRKPLHIRCDIFHGYLHPSVNCTPW